MQDEERRPLAARFERFARDCAKLDAPLYERLARYVANEDELLAIAAHSTREPIPNVFFGAIHYLLLRGVDHQLGEYYPSTSAEPHVDGNLFRVFFDFCVQSRESLADLVSTRLVQTNEVARSAILALGVAVVHELANREPLMLVEIGTSAGLNLLWDRYRICYSDGTVLGDPDSKVHIQCENRGGPLPTESGTSPTIVDRVGIDLNPIDLHDPDERLWLRALVWPDHRQRAERLHSAVALALQIAPRLIQGDALTVMPGVLASTRKDWTPCVFHSSVLYQFTDDQREQFSSLLAEASTQRPIWQVSAEDEEGLKVILYRHGRKSEERLLAAFDAHGRWLRWES